MVIRINNRTVSEEQVNRWKMSRVSNVLGNLKQKAEFVGDTDEVMRNLASIKLQYSYDDMLRFLKRKVSIGNFFIKIGIALSGSKRKFAVTQIWLDGVSAADISEGIDRLMLDCSPENDRVNLSACPEHYVIRPLGDNKLEVIETCGNAPVPTQFFIEFGDETGIRTPRDMSYPYQSAGVARMKNGRIMGGVRHQFRDTETGIEARLSAEFPAFCPGTIIRAHQMHLACEFSYWLRWVKHNNRTAKTYVG